MRHARILNTFMSSILHTTPPTYKCKTITTCVGCGRFQLKNINSHLTWSKTSTSIPYYHQHHQYNSSSSFKSSSLLTTANNHKTNNNRNGDKKYADLPINSRPAEPSIAIRKLSLLGRSNEAVNIYLQLLQDGGFPSREALYQLTCALYKSANILGMYAVHDTTLSYYSHNQPSKRSVRAMVYMYTMLINMIASQTHPVDMDAITRLCKEMAQLEVKLPIAFYNSLIKVLLDQGLTNQADTIYEYLVQQNLQPTPITFGIFMKDASRCEDWERMLRYLDEIEKWHPAVRLDYAVVNIIMVALCDMHEFDYATLVVSKLCDSDDLASARFRRQLLALIKYRKKKRKKKIAEP